MKTTLLLVVCLACLTVRAAGNNGPKVGDKPPLLQATTLLQAPPGATMNAKSLRGKVVVLEFWATWCGPCVAAIPHMNELADKFKGKPVQFIAITAEDEATIKPFLTKRPIHAWVALDTNQAMNNAYGVRAIPHTVVLDKNGKIAAITYPTMLTEKHISGLLAGRKIDLKEPSYGKDTVENKNPNDKPPLFEVSVRPSVYTNSSCGWGGGRLNARAYAVWSILPIAFDKTSARILTNAPLPGGTFDFTITQPRGADEGLTNLLQQALKSGFGLVGRKETHDVDVFLLKVKETNASGLVVSPTPGGSFRSGPGLMQGMNVTVSGIVRALENNLKKPVIDETGLTNSYDVTLKWEQKPSEDSNPEALMKAVREQLGLELVTAIRPVEMVRIEQIRGSEATPEAGKVGH